MGRQVLILRRLLQFAFALLCVPSIYVLIASPTPDYELHIGILIVLVLVILGLGPGWPDGKNTKNSKFDLIVEDPKVAVPIALLASGIYVIYDAYTIFATPDRKLYRFENQIAAMSGTNGVALFWAGIGVFLLWSGLSAYRRARKSRPNQSINTDAAR